MKKRPCYLLVFILLSLLTLFILQKQSQQHLGSNPRLNSAQQYPKDSDMLNTSLRQQSQQEHRRFISYFPHGDLMDQVNSLRNGLRLALDTNRTLILPYLRLGAPLVDWLPFEDLAKRYESQDKTQYSSICNTIKRPPVCNELDSWTEIPWSTLFDLTFLKNHSINVVERRNLDWRHGGGWIADEAVVVVDPLTYWENGTNFDTHEEPPTQQTFSLWHWFQHQSLALPSLPLEHRRVSTQSLQQLDTTPLVQFGSLTLGSAIVTTKSAKETQLLEDLGKRLVPNQLPSLNHAADSMIKVLGGSQAYTSFHLHLSTLIQRESDLLYEDNIDDRPPLSKTAFLDMMKAIVFELLGEIPISQALSASLPLQPSLLLDYLQNHNNTHSISDALLDVCIDYRNTVDPHYPVVYLVTDIMETPDRDSMAPLLDLFPCLLTRNDLQRWNPLPFGWSSVIPGIGMNDDTLVNYDVLLEPFLDILVADETYSFLEMPLTPLSMFITKQHHHK